MTQEQKQVLCEHFDFDPRTRWTSLVTRDDAIRSLEPGTRGRFGKVQKGCLYFTIGETDRGRACTPPLSDRFHTIIASYEKVGVVPVRVHTSASSKEAAPRAKGWFVGFDLHGCPADVLESIVVRALNEVRACAAGVEGTGPAGEGAGRGAGADGRDDEVEPERPVFTVLTERDDIAAANQLVFERLMEGVTESARMPIGYHGGRHEGVVRWRPDLGIWFTFVEDENRYWNAFGLGYPFESGGLSIVVEINPPIEGLNRRIAGAFATDTAGTRYLLHRGKVGGGRSGIGKTAFMRAYRGSRAFVDDGGESREVIVVGALDDSLFPQAVAAFVRAVAVFKESVAAEGVEASRGIPALAPPDRALPGVPPSLAPPFSPEFGGRKVVAPREQVVAECRHGVVVNALEAALKERGFRTGNDQPRDLFLLDVADGRTVRVLLEAKSAADTTALYQAVGQHRRRMSGERAPASGHDGTLSGGRAAPLARD